MNYLINMTINIFTIVSVANSFPEHRKTIYGYQTMYLKKSPRNKKSSFTPNYVKR